ncbi:hypothetical protein [Ruania zhangjianzhongii]|uniref:hypothetical protein n=1 Tax=Ruania zhangjianzhongii TaxID=2603206 RepID=UPI0011CC6745|nr:hypothetical protein [Ruania zhangjianzhongii]
MTAGPARFPDPHERHAPDVPADPGAELAAGGARQAPVAMVQRRRTRRGAWLTAAVLVVLLAIGVVVDDLAEEDNPHTGHAVSFAIGEDVTLRNFQVHVHEAQLAEELVGDETVLVTEGMWVVLDLSYATVNDPEVLSDLGIRDSQGRTYSLSSRYISSTWEASPDTWFRGEVVFEVARDSADSGELTLFVWPDGRSNAETYPMSYGVAELPVDPAAIATDPIQVAESEIVPAGER